MSFTDPLSITIAPAAALPLPRTGDTPAQSDDGSVYTSGDGLTKVTAAHTKSGRGRTRRMVRVDVSKLTSNPYDTSQNMDVSMSVHVVFDVPPAGYTATEQKAVFDGFRAMLGANTDQIVTKLLGGES